tara:strand:- start:561 stop:1049 length:489 start_codon:yes stop_codon:yes gene_type:complete
MSEKDKITPLSSPKEDLRKMSKNSGAVVGELREFLATLKGKSPKEMMGAVADSSLFMSLVLSTGIMIALLLVLTAVPYAFLKMDEETASGDEPAKEEAAREDVPASNEEDTAQPSQPSPEAPKTKQQQTADALGIGEQKPAAPDSNPLESSADDLLEGLDDI